MTTIDGEVMAQLRDIMGAQFTALIHAYIHDTDQRLGEVDASLAAGDVDGLRRIFHSIAGSSVNLGILVLADSCKSLETQLTTALGQLLVNAEGGAQVLQQVKQDLPQLRQTYADIRSQLQLML